MSLIQPKLFRDMNQFKWATDLKGDRLQESANGDIIVFLEGGLTTYSPQNEEQTYYNSYIANIKLIEALKETSKTIHIVCGTDTTHPALLDDKDLVADVRTKHPLLQAQFALYRTYVETHLMNKSNQNVKVYGHISTKAQPLPVALNCFIQQDGISKSRALVITGNPAHVVHFAQNPNAVVLFNRSNFDNVFNNGPASATKQVYKHQFDTADKSQIMYFNAETDIEDFVEFFKYL